MEIENSPQNVQEPPSVTPEQEKAPAAPSRKKKIILKIAIILLAVGAIGGLVYYFKGLFVAATVNGFPIMRVSVIRELERASGKEALDAILSKKLVEDEAKNKGITVTAEEIDSQIKNIEDQLKAQNQTMDDFLKNQRLTKESLREEIVVQKELEKLLGDKVQVTDEEVNQYITDYGITIPEGQETYYREQVKNQIRQQKFSDEAGILIESLKAQAKIKYFVNYPG